MSGVQTALVALGSNVGERTAHLEFAIAALQARLAPNVVRSPLYETAPVGLPEGAQPVLNGVCRFETTQNALSLVSALLEIEREAGRVRQGETTADRTLDLDLLLLGNCVCDLPAATVPHPRLHHRAFVLVPACDVAPDVLHPLLGKTLHQLLLALRSDDVDAVRAGRRPTHSGALPASQRS